MLSLRAIKILYYVIYDVCFLLLKHTEQSCNSVCIEKKYQVPV